MSSKETINPLERLKQLLEEKKGSTILKRIEEYEHVVEGKPYKRWHGPVPKQDFAAGGIVQQSRGLPMIGSGVSSADAADALVRVTQYAMIPQGPEVVIHQSLQDQMVEYEWNLRRIMLLTKPVTVIPEAAALALSKIVTA